MITAQNFLISTLFVILLIAVLKNPYNLPVHVLKKKDDNAHVEQKNWIHVRQLIGYYRFDNPKLVELMNDLYAYESNPVLRKVRQTANSLSTINDFQQSYIRAKKDLTRAIYNA
ncbi:TPA: hypothetical protein JBI12_00715 [Legionella pneumophila]|nr:hypothetical protein [Legionella pneumophila]